MSPWYCCGGNAPTDVNNVDKMTSESLLNHPSGGRFNSQSRSPADGLVSARAGNGKAEVMPLDKVVSSYNSQADNVKVENLSTEMASHSTPPTDETVPANSSVDHDVGKGKFESKTSAQSLPDAEEIDGSKNNSPVAKHGYDSGPDNITSCVPQLSDTHELNSTGTAASTRIDTARLRGEIPAIYKPKE